MKIEYLWRILNVESYSDKEDFIYAAEWELTGLKFEELPSQNDPNVLITVMTKTASICDRIGFSYNPNTTFIPRNEISDELMVEWVENELGFEKIQEIKNQIIKLLEE